jgi:hypothetical protein
MINLQIRLPSRYLMQFVAVPLAVIWFTGCSKGPAKETAADDSSDEAAVDAEPAAGGKENKPAKGKKKKTAGKFIGQIPIDAWPEVWFKDPLAIAAEKGPASAAVGASAKDEDPQVAKTGGSDAPPNKLEVGTTPAPVPEGGSEWATLINGEVMAAESKSIKNSLTDKLANKGRYDSTYKDLRVDAAALTVLAGIAPEHPEAPNWKANAKYVRDMASQVASGSTANGEKFYIKVRAAFDKLDELLAGSKPGGIEEAADKVKFSEVAARNHLMTRMQRAYDAMKANVNTEAIFKKELEKVNHEASMLALLSTVITTPGYNDADDDDYRKFTEIVKKSGLEIEAAVKEQDFKAYSAALDRCYKACTECHQNFRNN